MREPGNNANDAGRAMGRLSVDAPSDLRAPIDLSRARLVRTHPAPSQNASLTALTTEALVAAAAHDTLEGASAALAEGLTAALDLRSVYVYLRVGTGPESHLRLVAQTGGYTAFMAETPTISMTSDLPVVRAVLDGAPEFDADPYSLGPDAESELGVGRWRATVRAQAEATLPLLVAGHAIGALTLSWPTPRDFSEVDRHGLELLADAAAHILAPLREGGGRTDPAASRTFAEAIVSVDATGRVHTDVEIARASLRASVAACTTRGDAAAFRCVASCSGGRIAIALGVLRAEDAPAVDAAREAGSLLDGWMSHGLDPEAALGALSAWSAHRTGGISVVSTVACLLDPERRFVSYATTGPSLVAIRARDARFFCDAGDGGVAGKPAGKTGQRVSVLLPGDTLAVWSGDAPGLSAEGGPAFVRSVLAGGPVSSVLAADLLRPCGDGGCASETAAVLRVGAQKS